MFSAIVSSGASGYAQNGVLVTTSAQSSATGETYEEAFNLAKQLSQQIADSTLQNDINVLNQTITMSELGYLGIGETGPTGATGSTGAKGPTGPKGATYDPVTFGVSLGYAAGSSGTTGTYNVDLGHYAGHYAQGNYAIAIGYEVGSTDQGNYAIAIGASAGQQTQSSNAIAIGQYAGNTAQGNNSIAIGLNAGQTFQGSNSIALGPGAGNTAQGNYVIALGFGAGNNNQYSNAIAVGTNAGNTLQGQNAIAIGASAGNNNQYSNAIAVGTNAGSYSQGSYAIAIGLNAGYTSQPNYSIVINASKCTTGTALNGTTASSFYVNPIRAATGTSTLQYNTSTYEITYDSTKTFVIDHPDNKEKLLVHGCLEGPEGGVYYRGKDEITNGKSKTIFLPDYVKNLATNFSVQITPIYNEKTSDVPINFKVTEVIDNSFTVYCDNTKFFWLVIGERVSIDVEPYKKNVEVKGNGPYTWI